MKGYVTLAMAALIAFTFTSCKKVSITCFEASSTYVKLGDPVSFTNCSVDGEEYVWHFGDGNTSTEASPTHTYAQVGYYDVTLTTRGKKQKTDSDKQAVVIEVVGNDNPNIANAGTYFRLLSIATIVERVIDTDEFGYPLFDSNGNPIIVNETTVDTMVNFNGLNISEDGTVILLPVMYPQFDFLNFCSLVGSVSGNNFSVAQTSSFYCVDDFADGVTFEGLSGSFSNNGFNVSYTYSFRQVFPTTTSLGILSYEEVVTGIAF